jgi:hypothetical protein
MDHHPNRREVLAAGAAGLGLALGLRQFAGSSRLDAAGACVLQRELTEGTHYLDLDLVRRDIRGGRKGTPLTLRFQVIDATRASGSPTATPARSWWGVNPS